MNVEIYNTLESKVRGYCRQFPIEIEKAIGSNVYDSNGDKNKMPDEMIRYNAVHAECDIGHGEEWFDRVLLPLINQNPSILDEVARGIATHYLVAVDFFHAIENQLQTLR